MQYEDHHPPHIHVIYGEYKGIVTLKEPSFTGNLPPRVKKLVLEWIHLHTEELLENWNLATEHKILHSIDPLL